MYSAGLAFPHGGVASRRCFKDNARNICYLAFFPIRSACGKHGSPLPPRRCQQAVARIPIISESLPLSSPSPLLQRLFPVCVPLPPLPLHQPQLNSVSLTDRPCRELQRELNHWHALSVPWLALALGLAVRKTSPELPELSFSSDHDRPASPTRRISQYCFLYSLSRLPPHQPSHLALSRLPIHKNRAIRAGKAHALHGAKIVLAPLGRRGRDGLGRGRL